MNLKVLIGFQLLFVYQMYSMPIDDDDMSDLSYLKDHVYKEPSTKTGKLVEKWNATMGTNPEELGEYAEGDIMFRKRARNGLIDENARWPKGIIPFERARGVFSDKNSYLDSVNMVAKAIDIFHTYTCIKFRKRTPADVDYISFEYTKSGCWSFMGRDGGKQAVNLQSPACTENIGTILHELMHAVGFMHEHNRPDRDDYVKIAESNIIYGFDHNFSKAEPSETSGFGVKYDYKSVMHYSSKAFSVNGEATIITKDKSVQNKIGQRYGFSLGDITKINNMYGCPEKTAEITKKKSGPIYF